MKSKKEIRQVAALERKEAHEKLTTIQKMDKLYERGHAHCAEYDRLCQKHINE